MHKSQNLTMQLHLGGIRLTVSIRTSGEHTLRLLFSFSDGKDNSLFLGHKLINDRVQQHSSNSNGASNQLDGRQRFTQNKSNTNNDNDTLGSVGNRLSDSSSLLQGHGGNLIVSVEPETRGDQVLPYSGRGLAEFPEFSHSRSFPQQNDRQGQQESHNGCNGELVSNRSNAFLDTFSFHQFLVFISLDGSKGVGNAGRNQGRPGKVKLLHRGQNHSTNHNGKAQPLGLGDRLSIDKLSQDGGKGGFGSLDNLGK
mmetsp:Transcript_85406/g.167118  ORF Transcript_85406/g.167118 Transcript_85406/m.167118 type:complete len:254 (+) Transcript_85406:60-821(+)